jgi:glyoxylase-like metal-dependent hydrolase (beta-lactamase superfamily II)
MIVKNMFKYLFIILAIWLGATLAQSQFTKTSYTQARRVLDAGVAALGGIRAIQAIEEVSARFVCKAFDEGQSAGPDSPYFVRDMQTFIVFKPRQNWSYQEINTTTIGGLLYDPRFVIKGDDAGFLFFGSSAQFDTLERLDVSILKGIYQLYPPRHFPFQLLRTALRHAASLRWLGESQDLGAAQQAIACADVDGTQLTLFFEAQSHLPARLEVMNDHPVYGDATAEIIFSDYQETGGVKMPHKLIFKNGGETFFEFAAEKIAVNAKSDPKLFEIPIGAKATAFPEAFAPQKLAENVYFVPVYAGLATTYNSLVVVFEDFVLVIEAPLFDGYSRALAQVIAPIAPGKPVKYLAPTHYHTDHLGGIGHYIANGAAIITTPGNKKFIERLAAVKHTVYPNALSFNPKPPIVETFTGKRIISDGKTTLELHSIGPTPHVDEMVIAYLPQSRILFVSDLIMPSHAEEPPPMNESLKDLQQKVKKLSLKVEVIAPGHGPVMPGNFFDGSHASDSK